MTIICFKNGSLAREKIREQFKISTGRSSANSSRRHPSAIMTEFYCRGSRPKLSRAATSRASTASIDEKNAAANCRAVSRPQECFRCALHSQWMQVAPEKILVTGGAANDRALLQVAGRRDELPRASASRFPRVRRWGRHCRPRTAGSPPRTKIPGGKNSSPASPRRCRAAKILPDKRQRRFTDKLLEKLRRLAKATRWMPII